MDSPRIHTNKAKCLKCNEVIESKRAHDFVQCGCKAIHVDGGREYLKRGFTNLSDFQELSEYIITWKDVLDCKKWYGHISTMHDAVKSVGYMFYVWNNRIYSTYDSEFTGKTVKDLESNKPPCIIKAFYK
jgi:hypothetical protein